MTLLTFFLASARSFAISGSFSREACRQLCSFHRSWESCWSHCDARKQHGHNRRSDHEQDHGALEHAKDLHARRRGVVLLLLRRSHLERIREAAARRRQSLAVRVVRLDMNSRLRLRLLLAVLLLLAILGISLLGLSDLSRLGSLQRRFVWDSDNELRSVTSARKTKSLRSCRSLVQWPGRRAVPETLH